MDIIMDNETTKIFFAELGESVVQTIVLNAAATIAVFGGMIAVGAIIGKVEKRKNKKSKSIAAE